MQPNMPHLWSILVIRIILPFNQFRSPGISGNFKPFLHTFLGAPGRFPGSLTCFLDLLALLPRFLVNFLDFFCWIYWYLTLDWFNAMKVKYQYYHQKKSRKWTNMPRKRVRSARRSRNPVQGSRKHITRYTEGLHKPRKSMINLC